MRLSFFPLLLLSTSLVEAGRSLKHVGKQDKPVQKRTPVYSQPQKRQTGTTSQTASSYLTNSTAKYVVNGSAIPDVDFDIGESYAGLLPISSAPNDPNQLYFWFFPSSNPAASDEILIWLNGGPGCSSLEGVLQENGPFLWQYGTYKPVKNPWTWVNLTNVLWVEQPIGTGFSTGTPTATSEDDVATQFMGFFKNFIDTFSLHGRKIYITGESYAGYYVPYIASHMLDANDTTYYNVEATMIYDPSTTYDAIAEQVPAVALADYNQALFPFNDTFRSYIHNKSSACGYDSYLSTYLTFPPPGPFPSQLPGADENGTTLESCDVFDDVFNAASLVNPCFDIYQVATTCPLLWDVLGFPGSFDYLPAGASIYFNQTDVKKAINAPVDSNWMECSAIDVFVNGTDNSPPSGVSVLPGVIERSKRTIIGHGALDMVLIANGTLLMIQNMTWGSAQGFQSRPSSPFYVPPSSITNPSTLAGQGVFGTTHTERGLTWVEVALSGHMIPQYAPAASYRTVEFLLGRIEGLESTVPFTTEAGISQGNITEQALGNGTAPPYKRGS